MSHNLYGRLLSWCKADRNRGLTVLALGILFLAGAACTVLDCRGAASELQGGLARNAYGEGSRTEDLAVEIDGEKGRDEIQVEVSERAYTPAEIKELFGRIVRSMDARILGENESLDRIESDMDLITEIPGQPIDVSWELDRYDVMNVYGELQEDALDEEGTMVTLQAVLTYREREEEQALYECRAMIYPKTLSGREGRLQELRESTEELDERTRTSAVLTLPTEVEGEAVHFYRAMDSRGPVLMAMAVLIFLLLFALEKQNAGKELEKKKAQMRADYPEIVSKLTLLLGAGMTVKRAWRKIAEDGSRDDGRGGRYAYEEMRYTCREMESGVTESESYERFGRRINMQEYLRLGALLSQNLRKGTKGLGDILRLEALQAFEDRKARARRAGEEAGTKLLMPMFLMLAVVLVIVVVPAFLSIQL